MHEDTSSLLPNRHLDRADALPSFLFEIHFSTPFLDLSAIVVWGHLLALQQLFSSFSWAFFVRLPQSHRKLHLLGMKRHRLTFLHLPCRRHRHRHLYQTHSSSLFVWFVVMCCGLKSPSKNSEYSNQQEFLLLHRHPEKFNIGGKIGHEYMILLCGFSKRKILNHRALLFQTKNSKSQTTVLFNLLFHIHKHRALLFQRRIQEAKLQFVLT